MAEALGNRGAPRPPLSQETATWEEVRRWGEQEVFVLLYSSSEGVCPQAPLHHPG